MPWIRITLLSVIFLAIAIFFDSNPSIYNVAGIAGSFAAVSGTLLGFIIAALSILTAMVNRKLVANLRKTGHYQNLLDNFFITGAAYLLSMIFSLLTLFLVKELAFMGLYVATFLMSWATLAFIVTGRKFSLLLRHIGSG